MTRMSGASHLLATVAVVALTGAASSVAMAQTAGDDPLLQLLVNKGIISGSDASGLRAVPPAQQRDRLVQLLQQKGVLTAQDMNALGAGEAPSPARPEPSPTPAAPATAAAAEGPKVEAQAPAASSDAWKVGLFKGRPSIYSADGANSLSLVGRLQFDVGNYFQNSAPGVGGARGADQRTQRDLNSGYDLRRGRLGITGTYARDWQFDFVAEFGNINTAGVTQAGASAANPVPGATEVTGQLLTASMTYNGFKNIALVAGYTDVYDAFGEAVSSADITFNERPAITNLVTTNLAGNEPRAAFGVLGSGERWYGEGWVTGAQNTDPVNGQQAAVAARGGFLPYKAADSFFAFGGSGSYIFNPPHNDAATGTSSNGVSPVGKTSFTLSERPELRIDPTNSITTGAINASHAGHYGLEFAGAWKSLWLDGEIDAITVEQIKSSPAQTIPAPDLSFSGYYAELGYFLTGEQRPYSTAKGAWTTVRPTNTFSLSGSGWGAIEVAGRYSFADLNSGTPSQGGVFGGKQSIYQIGLNWYPVPNVRFLLDYLIAGVDRRTSAGAPAGQVTGVTNLGTSFQAVVLRSQVNW
jgi:phosphate-selective porin OprO/OprP